MQIDAVQINARLDNLHKQRSQLLANMNAVLGAIEDCEHWLKVVMADDAKPPENVLPMPPPAAEPAPAQQ